MAGIEGEVKMVADKGKFQAAMERFAARRAARLIMPLLGMVAAILLIAWIDGGEEPLRTIVQPIDLPPAIDGDER